MTLFIVRDVEAAERVFPPITSLNESLDTQAKLSLDQRAAARLLEFSNRVGRRQKYFKWRLDVSWRFIRTLFMHRKAFEMEQAGEIRRADFFWGELYEELERIIENDDAWSEFARVVMSDQSGSEVLTNPLTLRAKFIEEI